MKNKNSKMLEEASKFQDAEAAYKKALSDLLGARKYLDIKKEALAVQEQAEKMKEEAESLLAMADFKMAEFLERNSEAEHYLREKENSLALERAALVELSKKLEDKDEKLSEAIREAMDSKMKAKTQLELSKKAKKEYEDKLKDIKKSVLKLGS